MELQAGAFIEPVTSQTALEQSSKQSGGCAQSPAAHTRSLVQVPEVSEISVNHCEQLENPVHFREELMHDSEYVLNQEMQEPMNRSMNSDLQCLQYCVLDTNAMIKLPRYVSEALYVTDLHPMAVEYVAYLYWLFNQVGNVSAVRVMRKPADTVGRPPLCYAFVNFQTVEEACRAWQTFNYHVWMGIPMRIMFSNLDPATRYNDDANIIITNLEESIDSHYLHRRFDKLGVVLSSKVEQDPSGMSMGRGFIQFQDEDDAQLAIETVNNQELMGRKVYVGPFMRREFNSESGLVGNFPIDPIPAYNSHIQVEIPSQVLAIEALSTSGVGWNLSSGLLFGSYSNPTSLSHDSQLGSFEPAYGPNHLEANYEALTFQVSNSTDSPWSTTTRSRGQTNKELRRILKRAIAQQNYKARRLAIIEKALKELKKGKMSITQDSETTVEPSGVPNSEPWPPQPWSVQTLMARLTKACCPEERLAMLGGTLFPLVSKQTKYFVSEVTNELVQLDIKEIVKIMKLPEEALYQKVEEVKWAVCERIKDLPPFFPTTEPVQTPATAGDPASSSEIFTGLVDAVDSVEEVKHVIFEEVKKIPRIVSTSVPSQPPAIKDLEECVPVFRALQFAVPVVPEFLLPKFLLAQVVPEVGLVDPLTTCPLLVLPYLPHPLYARRGTGFYEPRVCNDAGLYSTAEAFFQHPEDYIRIIRRFRQFIRKARKNPVQDEEPVAGEFVHSGPTLALAYPAETMELVAHEVQAQEESPQAQEELAQREDLDAGVEIAYPPEKPVFMEEPSHESTQG